MGGLILKDLYGLKQQLKIYIIIAVVWLLIAVTTRDMSFFSGLVMMFTFLVPITSLAYDEKSRFDAYALTMPVKRSDIVLSKYLLSLICGAVCALAGFFVNVICMNDIFETAVVTLILLCVGIFFSSIVLPLLFRFGVEKGRTIMMAVLLLPVILALLFSKFDVAIPENEFIKYSLLFVPVITAVVFFVSFQISKKIYEKKEF
jgi:predicted transporter protein